METIKKRGRKPHVASIEEIRTFVIANGSKMTNEKMATTLKVKPIRIAACIAALKRTKQIDNNFLLTDILPKQIEIKTEKRGRKAIATHISEDETRTGKAIAREITIAEINMSENHTGKIASLPASKCTIERKVLEKVSQLFSFDLVEANNDTFKKLLLNVVKHGIPVNSVNNCFIGEVMQKAKKDEYSHLILDYCVTFGTIYHEISEAMKNDIVKVNGIIAITISQRGKDNLLQRLSNEITGMAATKTEKGIRRFVSKFNGYELKRIFSYRDGTPMMLIIIKRLK